MQQASTLTARAGRPGHRAAVRQAEHRPARRAGPGLPARPVAGRHHGGPGRRGRAGRFSDAADRPTVARCRDGGAAVARPRHGDGATTSARGAGLVRPPLRRPRLGLAGVFLLLPLVLAFVYSFAEIAPLSAADHLDRLRELRPDGLGPDLLPVGAEHGVVHHPHRARRDGASGWPFAVLMNSVLPGRRVVPHRHLPAAGHLRRGGRPDRHLPLQRDRRRLRPDPAAARRCRLSRGSPTGRRRSPRWC